MFLFRNIPRGSFKPDTYQIFYYRSEFFVSQDFHLEEDLIGRNTANDCLTRSDADQKRKYAEHTLTSHTKQVW